MEILWLFVICFFAVLFYFKSKIEKGLKQQAEKLKREEKFETTFSLDGEGIKALFDDQSKKIAFVSWKDYKLYSYSDVRAWEWKWVEKNAVKQKNEIVFKLRDKITPIISIDGLGEAYAEEWMARIPAILNQ
jgi:hypothetical protein